MSPFVAEIIGAMLLVILGDGVVANVLLNLNEVISKLSETDPADNTKGAALHSLAESIGFMDGLTTIPQDHRIITDGEIEV